MLDEGHHEGEVRVRCRPPECRPQGKGWASSFLFYTLLAALDLCKLIYLAFMLPGTKENPLVPILGTAKAKLFMVVGGKQLVF